MAKTENLQAAAFEPAAALATNLSNIQEYNATVFTRACDTLTKTAQAIWDSEPELFRLESEQWLKSLAPFKAGENGDLSAYYSQLHDGADRMVARMRHINDLAWGCGWEIAAIYATGLQDFWKPAQVPTPAVAPTRTERIQSKAA